MGLPPVKFLILTHHHWDHTFDITEWDLLSITNNKTSNYLNMYRGIKYDDKSLELAKGKGVFNGRTKQGSNHFDANLLFPMIQIIEYYVCSHESVCSRYSLDS
ncbi:MBL fold metallo-hydrolase [Viridibacillus soli]|uniref:MBL fold metallo-hydrolase n=1 Tax=Viridibacillus soli TaxID=2798301 RepID=UPI00389A7317